MAKTRRFCLMLIFSVLCACSFIVAACANNSGQPEEPDTTEYSVTYAAGASDAAGSAPVEYYKEGAPVTLRDVDTFERSGYTFTQWSDGTSLYDAGETFIMPAGNVNFTAQWEAAAPQNAAEGWETVGAIPKGALVTTDGSATANWFVSYTDAGLKVTAWVEDTHIYTGGNLYASDGVEVIFANVARSGGYTNSTVSVSVTAEGEKLVRNLGTNSEDTVSGLTVETKYLTLDGKTLAGYRVDITMPYSAANISRENKDAAVALGFTNSSNAGNAKTVYETSFGTETDRVNTYIAVTDDDTFEANRYLEPGSFWGNGGTLVAKSSWNLDRDDGAESAYIEMEKLDGDNNIYMRDSNRTEYYAEVQLHAKEILNGEKLSKFGLTVTKTDGTGFFYFIDARADDAAQFNADAINLNYVMNNNGWDWATDTNVGTLGNVTSDAYAGEGNYVTLGIYRYNGSFQFYAGDTPLAAFTMENFTQDAYIGLVSFNVLLSIKGYSLQTTGLEGYRQTLENSLPKTEDPTEPLKTLDGSMSDWTEAEKANPFGIPSDNGREVTVYASKDTNGVNIFFDVYHTEHKTTESDWFLNTNVEFRLGGNADKQYAVAANGFTNNVTYYYFNTVEENGFYHTVVEIFVPYSEISGYNVESAYVPANFYFKVGGLYGNVFETGDWWRAGVNNEQGVFITNSGIMTGSVRTIDGDDSDWADADWTTNGRSQWAAALEDDGLYLILKLSQENISGDRVFVCGADGTDNNWWLNQNIEILGGSVGIRAARIVWVNGKTYFTTYVNDAEVKYTPNANGNDELVFEIFIARGNFTNSELNEIVAEIGGQLFADATGRDNVWQTYLEKASIH